MSIMPDSNRIRKIALALAFIGLFFCLGLAKKAFSAEPTCQQYLTVCEKSCADRGGLFRYACWGPSYDIIHAPYQCLCQDDLNLLKQVKK